MNGLRRMGECAIVLEGTDYLGKMRDVSEVVEVHWSTRLFTDRIYVLTDVG
jgi:hypothetical protein